MKKIIGILCLVSLTFAFASCSKVEADKDVESSITKLNQFNDTFAALYEDGVISTDTVADKEKSEYDELGTLANEYYEIMNKINSQIEEEREKAEKGKKVKGYEEAYKKALEANKEDIESATALFELNISKINVKTDVVVEEDVINDETISEEVEETEIEETEISE